jgi:hypothetical protein
MHLLAAELLLAVQRKVRGERPAGAESMSTLSQLCFQSSSYQESPVPRLPAQRGGRKEGHSSKKVGTVLATIYSASVEKPQE